MSHNGFGLEINKDVIAQIAGTAALEVNGVAGLGSIPISRTIDIANPLVSNGTCVRTDNGALILDIYLKVEQEAKVRLIAEEVQTNVKDRVQDMTGTPVAEVNVFIVDAVATDDLPSDDQD